MVGIDQAEVQIEWENRFNMSFHKFPFFVLAPILLWVSFLAESSIAQESHKELKFEVSFDVHFSKKPQTGTLYLLLSKDLNGEPRHHLTDRGFDGLILSKRVNGLAMGESIVFDKDTPGFPTSLGDLKPRRYAVQAILDVSKTKSEPSLADGNGVSPSKRIELNAKTSGSIAIVVSKRIQRLKKDRRQRVHYEYIESRLVGRQIGSRFFVNASVILPINQLANPKRKYPVQYWIPDIGENTRSSLKYFQKRGLYIPANEKDGNFAKEFIIVLLDSSCRHGFHGWLDSSANGSFRQALYQDIIPYIENKYPVLATGKSRFLVGKGAGGLAALNLLADRPDFYAGAWALAPDPVDFHDFYGLDLFADPLPNAFQTKNETARILVGQGGESTISIKEQVLFEQTMDSGNLFQSYDACYGELGQDLHPIPLIDPKTGAINPKAARRFREQDFLSKLKKSKGPLLGELVGKINIIVGDKDDFNLQRPVQNLKAYLDQEKMSASIEILPDVDHKGIDDAQIHLKVQRQIMDSWKRKP